MTEHKIEHKIVTALKQAIEHAKGDESLGQITTHQNNHQETFNELIKQNSQDVKRNRNQQMVDVKEIYSIGYRFNLDDDPDFSFGDLYKQIGLSQRSFNDDKAKGKSRLVTKYALLGLLYEQNQQKNHDFSYDELSIILGALINHTRTRAQPHQQEVANIQKIIMKLMLEKMEKNT